MTFTNFGSFGSKFDGGVEQLLDPETNQPAPSFEFPGGSGIEYLYQGAIWIGGIVDAETLVSVGWDGWFRVNEMFPEAKPNGNMLIRDSDPDSPYYTPLAISD